MTKRAGCVIIAVRSCRGAEDIRPPHCIDGFTKTPLQASVFARGIIAVRSCRGRTEGRSAFAYIRPPHCIDGLAKTPLQASVFVRGIIAVRSCRGRTEGRSAFAYIRPPHCMDGLAKTPLQASVFARGKIAGGPAGGRTIHSSNCMDGFAKTPCARPPCPRKRPRRCRLERRESVPRVCAKVLFAAPQDIGVPADGIGFPAFPKDDEPKRKRTDFSQPASTGGNG